MLEIPPAKDTDAEDVVWGLQTAETLWKRGERIDALVWLRRAAQAAGDANDDDRALELARHAAELTEWMASGDDAASSGVGAASAGGAGNPADETPIELDEDVPPAPWANMAPTAVPPAATFAPPGPLPPPNPEPLFAAEGMATVAPGALADDEGRANATSVPPAEKVHAGMFDPWADQSSQLAPAPVPPPPPPPGAAIEPEEEEIVTSVRPHALSRPATDERELPFAPPAPLPAVPPPAKPSRPNVSAKPPAPPKAPPPLPPRARPPVPKPSVPVVASGPVVVSEPPLAVAQASEPEETTSADVAVPDIAAYEPPPEELRSAAPPALESAAPEPEALVAHAVEQAPSVLPPADVAEESSVATTSALPPAAIAETAAAPLDLDDVEAFADLPDDARTEFAAAAAIHTLAEGEEIGSFALAYVLSGSFDVAATVVDAPAVRLTEGAVLRARGTTDESVPIRLICATASGRLAAWSDSSVDDAFRSIPWVEEDLRAAADRVQTLVGITIGPLGERLDASIREEIVGRLTMRPLIAGEVVVNEGDAVPGLLLVGIGELELVKGDEVVGAVSSGDFLFPTEVLGAGSAPSMARAGAGGALVMFGDRRVAQELLVTCPPLLEVFAGM